MTTVYVVKGKRESTTTWRSSSASNMTGAASLRRRKRAYEMISPLGTEGAVHVTLSDDDERG